MALTLDATLAAAQDSRSRRPLVEIISSQITPDIPFDGTRLTSETFLEYSPSLPIAHSSGRLVLAYIYYSGTVSGIKLVTTDTARTEFTTTTLALYTYSLNEIKHVSICEKTNGDIGMILLVDDKASHRYRLTHRIYTIEGAAVSNAEIANWSHDTYTGMPWVLTKGTNDYYLVYPKISGSDYYVYARTSSDFVTWSAEGALSVGGLTSTWKLADPSLMKISTGQLWLSFSARESIGPNGEELTNIYYSTSDDNGTTWASATKLTNFTAYSQVGTHPVGLQKAAGQIYMIITKQQSVLQMDDSTSGWPTGDCASDIHFDSVNRKLYVTCVSTYFNYLYCIVKIDVDTWTVDDYWDSATTPAAIHPIFVSSSISSKFPNLCIGDGHLVPIACQRHYTGGKYQFGGISILDGEADTIKEYWFDSFTGSFSYVQNVALPSAIQSNPTNYEIFGVQIDVANDRIYIGWLNMGGFTHHFLVGYIELSDTGTGVPPYYTWNTVLDWSSWEFTETQGIRPQYDGGMLVVPDEDMIIVSGTKVYSDESCRMSVFQISDGTQLYDFRFEDYPTFPYNGIRTKFHYVAGKIWGGFQYESGHGQDAQRGLCELTLETGVCVYHRPSYATLDEYTIYDVIAGPAGKLLCSCYGYGIALFTIMSETWDLFSNDTVPGMTPDATNYFRPIYYDSSTEFIYTGTQYQSAWTGIVMFSIYGFIKQANYSIGTWNGASWDWTALDELVQGYLDYDAVAVPDPDTPTSMFTFWSNEGWGGDKFIKWDKDGSSLDLGLYLVDEISLERSIDGSTAKLNFTATHGHLFDPYNLSSTFNLYLKKGRKLTVRWGEKVSGVDYWQNAGTFFITGSTLDLERGTYPTMRVEAEDQRCVWAHKHIYATELYNGLPDYINEQVLMDHADLEEAEISMPVFTGGTVLEQQWLDTTIDEIINQICNRFGYYFRMDVDNLASARQITNAGSIDHTYPDSTKIIRYSPDDKYSDFTNRVTVQGQELDYTQILFTEEPVGILNGTVGWWGFRKNFDIWYSDDHSRQCVYPRMEVVETATSIAFKLAGEISESLAAGTETGNENKYCTITVSAPNLIPLLAASIAIYVAGTGVGDIVIGWGGGMTVPLGRIIEKVGLLMCIMVLGSTGNFQYKIHAQPVGYVRRSIQATWDDEAAQAEIGAIIEQTIQDALCYSVADCAAVAVFEGMICQMQRKRVRITKIVHLQDEDGDTIRIVHPYSNQYIDLYIANIKRRFKKPETDGGNGYFLDDIEGWVVN
jgi:hypothetical protein